MKQADHDDINFSYSRNLSLLAHTQIFETSNLHQHLRSRKRTVFAGLFLQMVKFHSMNPSLYVAYAVVVHDNFKKRLHNICKK